MTTTRSTRPNCAPAYYLGRPATMWRQALSPAGSAYERARPAARPWLVGAVALKIAAQTVR